MGIKQIRIDLENCYGIKALQSSFDFSDASAYAIYAPNGAMKTSFAQTFRDHLKRLYRRVMALGV